MSLMTSPSLSTLPQPILAIHLLSVSCGWPPLSFCTGTCLALGTALPRAPSHQEFSLETILHLVP